MLKIRNFYIDLGTTNTVICASHRGILLNEPSVVATCTRASQTSTFTVGTNAKVMLGKTPRRLKVHRPLRDGVIADFNSTALMLNSFMQRIKRRNFWYRPRLIISLPYQVSFHERQAVREIGYDLGARAVDLLHEPVAAAIGAGLPLFEQRGCMIVDIGGGTTEIAIMSVGGIVNAQAVRTGGNHIDEAIISIIRKNHQFAIGELTAEKIKISVGSAISGGTNHSVEVGGLHCITGLPARFTVNSAMIFPAVNKVVEVIIAAIRLGLSSCPPEIAGDIEQSGITLTGGGALLGQIQTRIQSELGISVHIASNPLMSVAAGGNWALESPALFENLEPPN